MPFVAALDPQSQFQFHLEILQLRNEIDILRNLDHPNIIKPLEVYDGKKQIYMVLELCDGGDLYKRAPYSEKDSATIMGKLLSAIKYMHDHGIVHRDLKFENIMFESKAKDAEIKVIDFGLSKKFALGEKDIMNEGTLSLLHTLCNNDDLCVKRDSSSQGQSPPILPYKPF